ncbi:MAG TPA: hypothetical protein VMT61_02775 [Candidatus Binataceae bacterium]|nr:hypothetical protein [Candidatus Binataceae bacterium]
MAGHAEIEPMNETWKNPLKGKTIETVRAPCAHRMDVLKRMGSRSDAAKIVMLAEKRGVEVTSEEGPPNNNECERCAPYQRHANFLADRFPIRQRSSDRFANKLDSDDCG